VKNIRELDDEIARLEKKLKPAPDEIVTILREIHSQLEEIRLNTKPIRGGDRPI